jgi:hypothetical protein
MIVLLGTIGRDPASMSRKYKPGAGDKERGGEGGDEREGKRERGKRK